MSRFTSEQAAKGARETPSNHPLSAERAKQGIFARGVTFVLSLARRRTPAPKPKFALASRPDLLDELDRLVLVDAVAAGALRR
ncbi:MAG: hypothetical protein ACSLFE_03710 [Gemmatimonadaceae bacterium]